MNMKTLFGHPATIKSIKKLEGENFFVMEVQPGPGSDWSIHLTVKCICPTLAKIAQRLESGEISEDHAFIKVFNYSERDNNRASAVYAYVE